MKKRMMKKVVLILGLSVLVGSCSSIYEKEPVGIGSDISELKRSPCACMLLKLPADMPAWMTANG